MAICSECHKSTNKKNEGHEFYCEHNVRFCKCGCGSSRHRALVGIPLICLGFRPIKLMRRM